MAFDNLFLFGHEFSAQKGNSRHEKNKNAKARGEPQSTFLERVVTGDSERIGNKTYF